MDVLSSCYATSKNRRSDSIDRREQKIDLINHGLDLMNNINKAIISLLRQMNDKQKALEDCFYKSKKKKKKSVSGTQRVPRKKTYPIKYARARTLIPTNITIEIFY